MLRSCAVVWTTCLLATAWGRYLSGDEYGTMQMQGIETETATRPIENRDTGSQQVQQMGYAYGNQQQTTSSSQLPPTSAPTQMLDIPMTSENNNYNQYSAYELGYDEGYNSGASGEESGSGLIGFDPLSEDGEGSGEGSGDFHGPSDCPNLADGNYAMSACGHQFLVCSNGLSHVMDCPANFVYSAESDMCDWSHNVGCEGSGGEIASGEFISEESGSGAASGEESGEFSGEESGEFSGEEGSGEESGLTPIEPMPLPRPSATTTRPVATSTAPIIQEESTPEGSGLELLPSTSGEPETETSGMEETTRSAESSSTVAETEFSGEEGSAELSGEEGSAAELLGENQLTTTAIPSTSTTTPAVTEENIEEGQQTTVIPTVTIPAVMEVPELPNEEGEGRNGRIETGVEAEQQVQTTTAMPTSTSTLSDLTTISAETRHGQSDESLPPSHSTDCSARADGNYELDRCSSRFVSCSNGVGHLMNCPDQLVFSAQINACDFPSPLMCGDNSADTGVTTDALCSTDGVFAMESCSPHFHNCINGKLFDLSCDPGQLFSWARERCLPAAEFPECDLH